MITASRALALSAATMLVVLAAVVSCVAHAGAPCADRAAIVAELARSYLEVPVSMGLDADGTVLELLASADGKTWSLLRTMPNGTACIIGAGHEWLAVDRPVAGDPT